MTYRAWPAVMMFLALSKLPRSRGVVSTISCGDRAGWPMKPLLTAEAMNACNSGSDAPPLQNGPQIWATRSSPNPRASKAAVARSMLLCQWPWVRLRSRRLWTVGGTSSTGAAGDGAASNCGSAVALNCARNGSSSSAAYGIGSASLIVTSSGT